METNMKQSESISNLSKALFAFQSNAVKVIKKAENPFFKSKYADLPSILDEIHPHLVDSGLVVTQLPDGDGLTTMLIHAESGEYLCANSTMHPTKQDPQSIGSAITYHRRYAICAILGLNVDEDDDGNLASSKTDGAKAGKTDEPQKPWLNKNTDAFEKAKAFIASQADKSKALAELRESYRIGKETVLLLAQ